MDGAPLIVLTDAESNCGFFGFAQDDRGEVLCFPTHDAMELRHGSGTFDCAD